MRKDEEEMIFLKGLNAIVRPSPFNRKKKIFSTNDIGKTGYIICKRMNLDSYLTLFLIQNKLKRTKHRDETIKVLKEYRGSFMIVD